MKIISYNVRGLGGFEMRSEVGRILSEKKPYVLCLQETKLTVVDDVLFQSLWPNPSVGFSFQLSIGASGGILTAWDHNVVEVWSMSRLPHVLVIRGRVIQTGQEFIIANVNAPCDTAAKQLLWDTLLPFVIHNSNAILCLCGGFNYVRSSEERKGQGTIFRQHDSGIFNKFIDDGFFGGFADLWEIIHLVSR